jgi:transcription-repair coupling factor (superfamily II helicase)
MTATPIPRTLAMAMEGLRDFSVIATAPQRRLSIKTFVAEFSEGVIREAALRELKRGGQIYFLHNDIDTINTTAERLEELLPEARLAIAHGQMGERDLEHVMREFYAQRVNLLLCSTIIESGIDVPSANTIIIERADRFGLAQLHQLRGRVGRSHHQAYAYLLTPPEEALSAQAKKRLEAIQMMEELGSGFYLSMQDLEIRGAGEVLGESQSGEMQEVGFNLYTEMLNAAVKSLKAGKEPDLTQPLAVNTEINLHAPALLPETYCADIHERLVLYKRLANCETLDELELLQEELVDRFGLLPDPARALVDSQYGIGGLLAVAVWSELGDCRRFSRSDQAVRHTGLDVTVDASDLRRAGGYLSRQGPATLRWALFEAAHNASRAGSPDHDYYTAVKDRHDGKLAAISVARQFARRSYHILRNMDPDVVYAVPA